MRDSVGLGMDGCGGGGEEVVQGHGLEKTVTVLSPVTISDQEAAVKKVTCSLG